MVAFPALGVPHIVVALTVTAVANAGAARPAAVEILRLSFCHHFAKYESAELHSAEFVLVAAALFAQSVSFLVPLIGVAKIR